MPSTVSTKTANITNATTAVVNTVVKASAGRVKSLTFSNVGATGDFYVKLYDKATVVVPASDVPVIVLKVTAAYANSPVSVVDIDWRFLTGLAVYISTATGDTDTTVLTSAKQIRGTITYK